MKFREVKTYQSVRFGPKEYTFFSNKADDFKPDGRGLTMEELSWGIRIKSNVDEVIISFNNVAYAKVETSASAPAATKKTAEPKA